MKDRQNASADDLAARLVEQADQMSPAFSEALHQRIVNRLAREVAPPAARPSNRFWHIGWPIPFAAAAALLLAGGLAFRLWQPAQKTTVVQLPATHPAALPALPSFDVASTQPLTVQLVDAQYAYLDRDAQRLTQFVIRQLDVLPNRQ